ncbi:MAG: FAD-dependent oxidoreductase [Pseudonocardia sp.]|uniref:NAD(P)/FAD-dependent oxidoreductase n=1 Tax=unclassified Pseudonocardia TaxID=2619320 RepID=UPI000868DEF4|nr:MULTISPECIES: FAD-dependent oxidoreductase [unclassified Pseudonocardia]MBN9108256.1 FAD-dependent oxidoreductase [Pseudonocardia sp.]ODU25619.1 MAG: NAD/FAD-dependent oxidoreductase [Pseudonocardia sp. SCN 72-51]ODV08652.1 MAG: NAD/FAD-dependent oxidoreductase [Pseudonocardia sp. SCN 73-27]
MSVVVVGAGLAGIACAAELVAAGVAVRVLDRADHVGGRMATRTVDGRAVDTGAAYFTVRDPEFAEIVARWRTAGLARPWTPELAVLSGDGPGRSPGPMRWSAPQGLRSLVEHLAVGLSVELNREVCRVGPGPTVDGESTDTVVLAMPDPQAVRLLHPSLRAYEAAAGRSWRPVVAVAAGFETRSWGELPAAFVNDHPVVSMVADDGARRGDAAPVLVAHTTSEVARKYDADPDGAIPEVLDALSQLLDVRDEPVWTRAYRWRYAAPEADRDVPFLLGRDGVALAGDGWGSSRIETAWRSGTLLGRELARRHRAS